MIDDEVLAAVFPHLKDVVVDAVGLRGQNPNLRGLSGGVSWRSTMALVVCRVGAQTKCKYGRCRSWGKPTWAMDGLDHDAATAETGNPLASGRRMELNCPGDQRRRCHPDDYPDRV